jgi:hypothetical protein
MNALISHLGLGLSLLTACATAFATSAAPPSAACKGTLYLTFDTGNMRHADLIAETLARHGVKATFFLAQEKTSFAGTMRLTPAGRLTGRRASRKATLLAATPGGTAVSVRTSATRSATGCRMAAAKTWTRAPSAQSCSARIRASRS